MDKEAFNNALSLVVLALEVGFKGPYQSGPTMLPPHQWFRTADIVVAAMVRGALRSHQLRKEANFEFLSEGEHEDRLELNQAFEVPATEGEALRALLEHLSGLLEGNNALGYDANPEGFYDHIKMRTRTDLEALALADAKAEMTSWRREVIAKARYEQVHEFLDHFAAALQSQKWANEVTLDRIDDLRDGFAEGLEGIHLQAEKDFIKDSLASMKTILDTRGWDDPTLTAAAQEVEAAYNRRYTEAYKTKIAEAEQLVQSEYVALLAQEREAMKLKVEVDVRNWSIGHKAERIASLQESMNSAVANDDKVAVYAAAKRLGISLKEEDYSRPVKPPQSARKRARKAKSVTGTIAAEDAEDDRAFTAEQRARMEVSEEDLSAGPHQSEHAPQPGHKRTASGARSSSVTSTRNLSPQRRPQGSEDEEEDDDPTPVASPAPERGRTRAARPLALPPYTAPPRITPTARSIHLSIHNAENPMNTEEDGNPPHPMEGREAPAPILPPGPVVGPVDLATITFGNNADPNILALVRLFQTLITPLSEKILAIDAKINATSGATRAQTQARVADPRPRPTSRPRPANPPTAALPAQARVDDNPPSESRALAPRGHPPPPSYANTARGGLTVTSQAIRQHQALEADGKAQAAARGRKPSGVVMRGTQTQVRNTEIVVLRYGGFADPERERALRARPAQEIVLEVRTAIERRTECPVKVLGGWWATRGNGNFVYTLAGDVSEATALSFKKWLCAPFPDADLLPTAGWVWAHLREVLTRDENGTVWDSEQLLKEVRQNTVFEEVTLCVPPRWQVPPERLMTSYSTVLVSRTYLGGRSSTCGSAKKQRYKTCGNAQRRYWQYGSQKSWRRKPFA